MSNNDWIKTTDRRPTEQDLPVWAYFAGTKGALLCHSVSPTRCTHWLPAKDDIPEPPQPEPTQRERDQVKFNAWWHPLLNVPHCADAWHAALAWERGEVAKMLPLKPTEWELNKVANAIESIRARCGGGK